MDGKYKEHKVKLIYNTWSNCNNVVNINEERPCRGGLESHTNKIQTDYTNVRIRVIKHDTYESNKDTRHNSGFATSIPVQSK